MQPEPKQKSLVLMQRDLQVLMQLYHHRTISSSQLSHLCFAEASYETARKRLRRLQQAGFTDCAASGRTVGRGRPELIYFLTASGAKALIQHRSLSGETVAYGPPHSYYREHFLRLVDIRLALLAAEKRSLIVDLEFTTGPELRKDVNEASNSAELADATITFCYPGSEPIKVLIEIDTGNFRQTRHWEPKIRAFLKSGYPIWVVTGSPHRLTTLTKWTLPLLQENDLSAGQCVFCVYQDLVDSGIFGATWWRSNDTITDLRPRPANGSRKIPP